MWHPEKATQELNANAYRAFRRQLKKDCAYAVEKLWQGRYNAHTERDEAEWIEMATLFAEIEPVTKSATRHPNQVIKTARDLYLGVMKCSGKKPKYRTWFHGKKLLRKDQPRTKNYMLRVQKQHKGLWKKLVKTIERNNDKD